MNTPFGVQTPLLEITQENSAFDGTLSGNSGLNPLEEVSVDGAQINFKTKVTTPMGSFPVSFSASVDGDVMKGVYQTMLGATEFAGERIIPRA
ncbi:MAG: hypothetical protein A3I66_02830 [Burkholderiales bacterium RIFCSPLOWO2_02_FULL_57_36]|nr:MAG: hypothetical protein A3I66_02830 [Burkholderiales bacterium RIFCSPLOWO2_02_FULL_57_36]